MSKKVDVTKIPPEYLHPECIKCIKEKTLTKNIVNKETGEVLYKAGEFPVVCKGILNQDGYKAMAKKARELQGITSEDGLENDVEILREAFDKTYWAKKYLNWTPRVTKDGYQYQEIALNCTSKRKALRLGRRSGKTDLLSIEAVHSFATSSKDVKSNRRVGAKVTFITPAETQRKEIFDRIRSFIYERLEWGKNEVPKDSNSPYPEIKTSENAVVQGFVTGTSSGADGTSIRGKGGDKNLWDEGAFISQDQYAVMMPLLAEHPDVELIVSSTPLEKEGNFYEFCIDPVFKEFHVPSTAMDFWTPLIDYGQRRHLGPIQYRQEILAEFGSVDDSVFSDTMRAKMFIGQSYESNIGYFLNNRDDYYIGLGVDWNGTLNGNQLCIMAMKKGTTKKEIVNRYSIEGDNVHTRSVQFIRELNQKWIFDFIYVDNGFGTAQIEMLHNIGRSAYIKYGKHSPDSNLRFAFPVNFQGKIKRENPIDKKEESKFIKVFMVDTILLDMEDGNIIAAEDDTELNKQMEMYKIARIMDSGSPKYIAGNRRIGDHALDSVMLCCFGFRMEYGDINKEKALGLSPTVASPYESLEIEALMDRNNYAKDSSNVGFGWHKTGLSSRMNGDSITSDRTAGLPNLDKVLNAGPGKKDIDDDDPKNAPSKRKRRVYYGMAVNIRNRGF